MNSFPSVNTRLDMLRAIARPILLGESNGNEQDTLHEIAQQLAIPDESHISQTLRSSAMAELARAVFVSKEGFSFSQEARDLFYQAHILDPENPYVFARYLHAHVIAEQNRSMIAFMNAQIRRAITTCREHAAVGIELPFAHFTEAMLQLLCGSIDAALQCTARGIAASNDTRLMDEEIELFTLLQGAISRKDNKCANQISLIISTIELGKVSRVNVCNEITNSQNHTLRQLNNSFKQPVIIIAGTCDPKLESTVVGYREYIGHALEDFNGTILCGGTNTGISGIVGDAVGKIREMGNSICLMSYWPETISVDYSIKHPAYDKIAVVEKTSGFGFGQPIQYWTDILLAGIPADSIRVLGVGGGKISLFEYYLATALGATVGIIEGSGRSGWDIVGGEKWWTKAQKGRCFTLPSDRETIWNFLNVSFSDLSLSDEMIKRYEPAACGLHENYVENARGSSNDKSLEPWDKLDKSLKISSYHQAIHASRILEKYGLQILPIDSTDTNPVEDLISHISGDVLEKLAEMEHGRWNVERLLQGWHYGPVKDVSNKVNPCIVTWKALPDGETGMKKFDREPFRRLPQVLRKAGLGIFRIQ